MTQKVVWALNFRDIVKIHFKSYDDARKFGSGILKVQHQGFEQDESFEPEFKKRGARFAFVLYHFCRLNSIPVQRIWNFEILEETIPHDDRLEASPKRRTA